MTWKEVGQKQAASNLKVGKSLFGYETLEATQCWEVGGYWQTPTQGEPQGRHTCSHCNLR